MRILIVTYRYHPSASPRAFRWTAIAEHWAAAGHQVTVVASRMPGAANRETCNGVEIIRIGPAWRAAEGSEGGSHTRPGILRRLARTAYHSLWRPFQWPDFAGIWRRPAVQSALEQGAPDLLVTVSHPFTGHLVGLHLKEQWPNVRWIADVGDPFCFLEQSAPNNRALFARRNFSADHAVFGQADAVAVTCEGTREEYANRFPETADKIHVIGPLLSDLPSFDSAPPQVEPRVLRCVFGGRFYRQIRNPGPLLQWFAAQRAAEGEFVLELHICGDLGDCADLFDPLPEGVSLHGFLPHEKALEFLRSGHVLIHMGNANTFQLPSKVVEYVALGRPILNFAQVPNGAAARFFQGFERTLTINATEPGFPESTQESVCSFLREALLNPVVIRSPEQIEAFGTTSIARQYEDLWR